MMYIFPVILSLNLSPIFIMAPSSFPKLPRDRNGLASEISLQNRGLPVLPFFQGQ